METSDFDRWDKLIIWACKTRLRAFLFGMSFLPAWTLSNRFICRHPQCPNCDGFIKRNMMVCPRCGVCLRWGKP